VLVRPGANPSTTGAHSGGGGVQHNAMGVIGGAALTRAVRSQVAHAFDVPGAKQAGISTNPVVAAGSCCLALAQGAL
jgi:hypothetical protein